MRTCAALLLALGVALAGCVESKSIFGDNRPGCLPEIMSAPYARDPATGKCIEFDSGCDVPAEWARCTPYLACSMDQECAATEHCADQPPPREPDVPARACVRNDTCTAAAGCAGGLVCDTSVPPPGSHCDPMQPGCDLQGTCARPLSTPPLVPACQATSECGALQICPAQYGGCSSDAGGADGGVACPSRCEAACKTDADCGDPMTSALRCNAADVCGTSNQDAMGNPGLACAGWCVKR